MNFRRIAPALLTGISVVASIAAVVMAVNETPRAIELVDNHRLDIDPTGQTDLAPMEKVVDYGKSFWKTEILLGVSIASSIGALLISRSNYKALMASTASLAAAYTKHKDKVREIIGEEKAKLLDKQVKQELNDSEFMTKKVWFQESVSGEFFQSTWKDIYEAEYEANKRIALEGFVTIGEIFPIAKNAPKSAKWMWTQDLLCEDFGYPWVDFVHQLKNCPATEEPPIDFNFNGGRETYVINYGIWPLPPDLIKETYGIEY